MTETETEFWRRKAQERALENARLREEIIALHNEQEDEDEDYTTNRRTRMKTTEALRGASDHIQYHETTEGPWQFATSYHGSGTYMLDIWTRAGGHPEPSAQQHTQFHLTRDQLTALVDLGAQAIGGCLYLAGDDANSEL